MQKISRMILDHFQNDETRWTQGVFARDKNGGGNLHGTESECVCWCIDGVLNKFIAEGRITINDSAIYAQDFRAVNGQGMIIFNDRHTFQELLTAIAKV